MPTIQQIEQAMIAAHRAGDTESARVLAGEINRLMTEAAAPPPKRGMGAAFQRGLESQLSAGRTGLGVYTGSPEEAARAGMARGEEIGRKYEDQIGLDLLKKAYEEKGLLAAGKEVVRQVPLALAEQAPQIVATLGSARVGAMAGAPLGPMGVIGGGLAGATIPSFLMASGSQAERRAQEQAKRGEPVSIDRGELAATAVPSAALDAAATLIPLGGQFASKLTGIPFKAFFGRSAAQAEKLANERLLATLTKGTATGVAVEVPTEILQQMLERAQAGLPLTGPEAFSEYGETAYRVGLLGPLGAVGRFGDKGAAQQEVADRRAAEAAQAQGAAVPTETAAEIPIEERRFTDITPVPGAPAAEPRFRDITPVTAPVEAAAPAATPQQPDIFKLTDSYETLKNSLDPLATRIEEARKSGDVETARSLIQEYRDNEAAMNALATQITEAGGVLESGEEVQAGYDKQLKSLDAKEAKLKNTITEMSRADVRDYDAVDKAEKQLEKLQEQRKALTEEFERKRGVLRVKETPAGEQISLFDAKEQQPKAEEVLEFETEKYGKITAADIEKMTQGPVQPTGLDKAQKDQLTEKQKEADALLAEIVGMAPRVSSENKELGLAGAANAEQRQTVLDQLNAARQQYRDLQETESKLSGPSAMPEYFDRLDAGKERLRKDIARLERDLERLAPRNVQQRFLKDYYAKSDKLNALYREIDSIGVAPVEKSSALVDMFDYANQLRTATLNNDPKTIMAIIKQLKKEGKVPGTDVLERAGKKASERAQRGMAERDKLVETLGKRLGLPGRVSERTVTEEEYDQIAARITELMDSIDTPKGRAKQSVKDKVERLAREIEGLDATLADKSLPAKTRQGASKSRNAKVKEYNHLIENVMVPARDEIFALYRSMFSVKEVAPVGSAEKMLAQEAEKTRKEQIAELKERIELYGAESPQVKEFVAKNLTVKMSPEYKRYKDIIEGKGVTSSPKRVAIEIGRETDEYKAFAAPKEKEIAKRKAAYEKYEADAKAELKRLKKEIGETSEDYKNREAEYRKTAKQKLDAWKNAEKALNKALDAKAEALGKASPDYRRRKLEATKKFKETVAVTGEQEVASKRTTQVTRKLPKLKTIQTASEESRAKTRAIQEKREPGLLPSQAGEKPEVSVKPKAEPKSASAMLSAFQAAATKRLKETGKFARGVEVESPDLTAAQIKLLEANDIRGALRSIMNASDTTPIYKAVIEAMLPILDATNVKLYDKLYDPEGREVLGEAVSKLVKLSRNGGLSQEVLLHEATHAAVERTIQLGEKDINLLTKEQQAAFRELKAIHARIKNDPSITSTNAKGSLSEFAAELFSNRNLHEQLRTKPWRISNMLDAIYSAILRILGVKQPQSMLGTGLKAVEALMMPTSLRPTIKETPVSRQYSAKDIAALETGSNSMKQFAEQFGPEIKQKDRTVEDVDRIAAGYINQMDNNPENFVAQVDKDKLDYKGMATMSDGKIYDPDNLQHFVEADITTLAAKEALSNPELARQEARKISKERNKALSDLASYLGLNLDYTLAEQALVIKAAAKYGVISGKDGRLKLVNISDNNRHPVAVVGRESANAVIEELRKGKTLKEAFLDGLQQLADRNAKDNLGKNGWQKFEQSTAEQAAVNLNAAAAGTPWCTGSSVETARGQISGGDFYIYYESGKPQVAVRMNGQDAIGEIRGNNPNQGLDSKQQAIAKQFLRTNKFKGSDSFIQQTERKEALSEIVSGRRGFTIPELMGMEALDSNGNIDDYAVNKLLNFRALFGYMQRVPSDKIRQELESKLSEAYKDAYAKGYWFGHSLSAGYRDTTDTSVETELFGKTYKLPVSKIRAAKSVSFYGSTDKQLYASLEYVDTADAFGGTNVTLPSLKRLGDLSIFPDLERPPVLTVADGAEIGTVRPTLENECVVTINGKVKINNAVLLKNTATLELNAPQAEYVVVDAPTVKSMAKNIAQTYNMLMRRKGRELGLDSSDLRVPTTSTAKKAVEHMAYILDDVFGESRVLAAQNELVNEGYDLGSNQLDAVAETVKKLVSNLDSPQAVLALADRQYKFIKGYLDEDPIVNPFPQRIGTVSAPNILSPDEAFTYTPERPRYALKNVGVTEDKPGIFSFKSFREPDAAPSSIVAQEQGTIDNLKANFLGLRGRVQLVDKFAAISEAFKKGMDAGVINALEASNGEYFLRFGENRSQYAQQVLTNGPLSRIVSRETKEGNEYIYKSEAGANLMRVFETLEGAGIKNGVELDRMFTVYQAGKRAQQVGWEKLWVGNPAKAKAEYTEVMAQLNANPQMKDAFEAASKEYKSFNNGLVDFLVQTGAITKDLANKLKAIDYVPYYRVNKGSGDVELFTDKEAPIRIGNIKDEPQLQELVGDNTQILPLSVSAVQNAFMLVDMGLRNQRVKDTSFLLHKIGFAKTLSKGEGPANRDTVRFKVKGEPYYAIIDSDLYGIPADLIVKGMEGIKTTLPMAIKAMGVPADILRKFVTRNPAYAIRQAFRDPLTAWLTTGTDGVPILNSFKELSSMVAGRSDVEKQLMSTGAISSNVFTGDQEDFKKFLRDISAGKSGWEKLLAKADAFALQGDAATRAVVYKDSIAKGMSEQQALLRTLESMNFGRRGLSPSMYYLNTLIPFFNAQVQGLDVLYRAFKGKMPYNDQLKIREKLIARGLLIGAATFAYAAMMQDDEAYKRAKPEERLANWFVYIPGMSQPLKVPIPFELGYLFKSLPEAVFNLAANDERSQDITKGMGKLLWQSNPFSLPQAVKPWTELYVGKSFFGGDIESKREIANLQPTERFRSTTTELSKILGGATGDAGITPIGWDHLFRGYTGGLGIALISLANPLLNTETTTAERPSKKLHETPFIGGLFQPIEGRGTLDAAYERMLEIQQAKGTFNRLVEQGRKQEALEFLDTYRDKVVAASLSGAVQQKLGELSTMRRRVIEMTNLSQEKKDQLLERLDEQQVILARRFLEVTGETRPQASRP